MSNQTQLSEPTQLELKKREERRIANCFLALFGAKESRNETQRTVMEVLEKESCYKQSVFTQFIDREGVARIDVNTGIQRDGSRLFLIYIKNQIKFALKQSEPIKQKTNKRAKTT